jgi:broad specificity phosphatase PhoE
MFSSPILIPVGALLIVVVVLFMRPRRFYFIRHGETLLNAEHVRQGEGGGLSEKGKQQAERVGKALTQFPVERIISSTYPRARETAMIINTYLHVSIEYSPLLAERRNPTEIIGKSTQDPEVMHIVDQMDLAYHKDDYRFSDEENFADLKKRARKCLTLFSHQGARHTAVVTHHHFLKVVIAYLLYRERLTAAEFVKLSFFNTADNAGLTVCEFNPWKVLSPTRGWSVISFNEKS